MPDQFNNSQKTAADPSAPTKRGRGRPKGSVSSAKKAIAEMAREYAEVALRVLVDVAKDTQAPAAARVSAANAIIDRGYGKAPATLDTTVNPLAEAIREISRRGSAMPIRSQQLHPAYPNDRRPDEVDEDIEP